MGDRRPFGIEIEFSSVYYLCDNSWHRVKVSLVNEEISLNVDGKNKMYWLPDHGHITEARTNSPLYIGGIAGKLLTLSYYIFLVFKFISNIYLSIRNYYRRHDRKSRKFQRLYS